MLAGQAALGQPHEAQSRLGAGQDTLLAALRMCTARTAADGRAKTGARWRRFMTPYMKDR